MLKADLHAHSILQPYGELYREKKSKKTELLTNIWYYNKPTLLKRWVARLLRRHTFSQSNFTSAVKGDVHIMGTTLYAPEISFFQHKLPHFLGNGLESIIARYGNDRIYDIESGRYDYFEDVQRQYQFLKDARQNKSNSGQAFEIVRSFWDIEKNISKSKFDVMAFLTIEGAHNLGCGYPDFFQNPITERQKERVMNNINTIKEWEHPVLFITLAHHFYNQVCGHCKSLPDSVEKICDQSYGMDFPISDFGFKVIDRLLNNEGERRILIDIKHMSIASRQHYIEYMEELKEQKNEYIPIIYSHGGPNGRATYGTYPEDSKDKRLNSSDLGLFDVEILAIADSEGIIGLNLDQVVMSSKENLSKVIQETTFASSRRKKYAWAGVIWNNIRYMAELLDKNGYAPWDFFCLGTDFDGAINPIHYFMHEKDMDELEKYLKIHIEQYLNSTECRMQLKNQLSATEILERIMMKNVLRFLDHNLRHSY